MKMVPMAIPPPTEEFLVSTCISLQKQSFLFAPRRWGHFPRKNVFDSATEITY